jgi:hypothetical protein
MTHIYKVLCFFGYHKMLFGYVHPTYPNGWYDKCKHCGYKSEPYEIEDQC